MQVLSLLSMCTKADGRDYISRHLNVHRDDVLMLHTKIKSKTTTAAKLHKVAVGMMVRELWPSRILAKLAGRQLLICHQAAGPQQLPMFII